MPLNPLGWNVRTKPGCNLRRSFCVWSDLLGFGRPFADADWLPDPEVWQQQATRVGNAYRTQCRFIGGLDGSYMLLLNDGIIRAVSWGESLGPFDLGSWLRNAVQGHYDVRRDEYAKGLPGPRTVISSGWVAEHSFSEVRLDDLVFDYTRQKPGTSNLAEIVGNTLLVSNPVQLQLNTAFSRSYLLDEAGSRAGLSGACLYLDEQFIDDVTALFESNSKVRVKKWTRENDILFAVEYIDSIKQTQQVNPNEVLTKNEWARRCQEEDEKVAKRGCMVLPETSGRQPWVFGFLLETPAIKVDLPNLKMIVYRVLGFFPFDEDPTEFMFELWPTNVSIDR